MMGVPFHVPPAVAIVPFEAAHASMIQLQPEQWQEIGPSVGHEHALKLARGGPAFTMLSYSFPVAAAGLIEVHPHYATAWALLGWDAGEVMLAMTRAIRQVLAAAVYSRVDTTVRTDFPQGQRWARMLGLERRCTMAKWGPDGSDFDLYERII